MRYWKGIESNSPVGNLGRSYWLFQVRYQARVQAKLREREVGFSNIVCEWTYVT